MGQSQALVIDDEPAICQLLEITLNRMSIATKSAPNLAEAKQLLASHAFDLCLTDMRLPDGDGLEFIAHIQENYPNIPIAVITAHGNMEIAIKALKLGAFDFISKPIDLNNLRDIVSSALKNTPVSNGISELLIGTSPSMLYLREQIVKLARSQAPIYISGSTGTGKELVAKIIHQSGPRHEAPFIPVNCGAIPQELMESEFFGHKKGSFTGALFEKEGFFSAAHKGTLFLDEVADLPLNMQVKLLRAIQEKAIRPVGSTKEILVDVRLLCATHKDLSELVRQNLFRQDLFYRINVIEVKVPSLKERVGDIPLLTQHILKKLALLTNKAAPNMTSLALRALNAYSFPGNIRELENILERAFVLCDGQQITLEDLHLPATETHIPSDNTDHSALPLDDYLIDMERQRVLNALHTAQGNKTAAAKLLGVSFRTLRYRLKKLGLDD